MEPRERTARVAGEVLRERAPAPGGRLLVLAAGKAARAMTLGLLDGAAEACGPLLPFAVVGAAVGPDAGGTSDAARAAIAPGAAGPGAAAGAPGVEWWTGAHPVPGPAGEAAGRRLLALAATAGGEDLVIGLLSGGASALVTVPAPGLRLEDLAVTTRLLLASGAPIAEVNTVRKHLSATAGGRLGVTASAAPRVCLLVSDVVGDDPGTIGSGPFFGDDSTFRDCLEILRARELIAAVPTRVRLHLQEGAAGRSPETPRPDDPRLRGVEHRVVASNLDACRAVERECVRRGYAATVVSHTLTGEARDLGSLHAGMALGVHRDGAPLAPPCALVTGGEATVTVRGDGVGGRNQETCLAAAEGISGLPAVFLSAGTDGVDGPTGAAGGLVDGTTWERARATGIDLRRALGNNDSHTALRALGDLVVTGPTGTNVADVRLVLVDP